MIREPPPQNVYAAREPGPALRSFVQTMFYFEAHALHHARERILPTSQMQILLNLDQDSFRWWDGPSLETARTLRGGCVSGAFARPFAIETADQRRVVGVALHPGCAAPILGFAAHDFKEDHVGLDDVWGRDGMDLREELCELGSPERILARLDSWLTERVSLRRLADRRVLAARDTLARGASVRDAAAGVELSARRLRDCFHEAVGLTPRAFGRVARLGRVLEAVTEPPRRAWADVAVHCGYYDQAHLIHEFRALTGLTPARYAPRAPGDLHHVVLD